MSSDEAGADNDGIDKRLQQGYNTLRDWLIGFGSRVGNRS